MTPPSHERSRRDFLTALAATAAAGSLGTLATPTRAAAATSAPFDDTWTERVRAAKHKAVFDAPDPSDGLALLQPWIYRRGFETMASVSFDTSTRQSVKSV